MRPPASPPRSFSPFDCPCPTVPGPEPPPQRARPGENEILGGRLQVEVFILSACQWLMIELKKFCHEKQFEMLFEKYTGFKVLAVTMSCLCVVPKQRWH